MTIHVTDVGCHLISADLYQLFATIGNITYACIITDKETGKSLRYGFVEMPDDEGSNKDISQLHGKVIEGRTMSVVLSKAKLATGVKLPLKVPSLLPRARRFA
jgi:U11/U12 small nuclear ribonucleoprotein SNRNP31